MKRGLVIGKFCPLHKGHQLLIETALQEVDELHLWSWSEPEYPQYPPTLREHWLHTLYPRAKVEVLTSESVPSRFPGLELPMNSAPDIVHQVFVAKLWGRLVGHPLDVVYTSETYGDPLVGVLSTLLPQAHAVAHRLVDLNRVQVPISGTRLRAAWQPEWLSPVVHGSTRRRVVFLGAESTGKTTLSAWASQTLGGVTLPEYGRTLWEQRRGNLVFDDMLRIAEAQIALEEQATHPWQFCDTSPLTTLFYSQALFGRVHPRLEQLSQRPYDLTFLCRADFPLVQDGTRQDEEFRRQQESWYLAELHRRRTSYTELSGDLSARQQLIQKRFHEILHPALPRIDHNAGSCPGPG
jgi:NadR type nicotinamide-nucleotide adenylyltransferase